MDNKKTRARKYCAVFNCLNTDRETDLTFFKLPKDDERCRTWLKLIDREDLLQKQDLNKSSYYVCSQHFGDSSFKIIKQLKDDALPSISLHNQPQEDSPCSQQPSTSSEVKSEAKILFNKIVENRSRVKSTPKEMKSNSQMYILPKSKEYATIGTQTDTNLQSSEEQTQTPRSLTAQTPRKRKLSNKLQDCKLKRRMLDQEPTKMKKKLGAKKPV